MAGTGSKSKSKRGSTSSKKKQVTTGVSIGSSTPSRADESSPASVTRREPPPEFVVPASSQISIPTQRKSSSTVQEPRTSQSPGSQTSGLRPQHQLQRFVSPQPTPSQPLPQNEEVQGEEAEDDGEDDEGGQGEEGGNGDAPIQQMALEALLTMGGQGSALQRLSPFGEEGTTW